MWQIKSIELKDVGENHLSLLCNKSQLRRGLNWSRRNWSLKINSVTRMEILGETWRPRICSCYLMKWFLYLLSIVGTLYLMYELVWLTKLILISEVLLRGNLLYEWNLTCQQGVLNIVCNEPYGCQLKRSIPTTEMFLTKEP